MSLLPIRKLKLHLGLKKLQKKAQFLKLIHMKKEDRDTYGQMYEDLQSGGIQSLDDFRVVKDILFIRIASIQKNMTYLSKYNTTINQARLGELTRLYQLIEKATKASEKTRKSQ